MTMRFKAGALALSALILSAAPAMAQAPAPAVVAATTPLGSGPFKAIMEADPGLPGHTVYRPASLAGLFGQKLPIVAWGNGACVNAGNRFRWFLSEISSYGFLAIAIGPIGPPSMEGPPRPAGVAETPPTPPTGPPATRSAQLIEAIDWALAENERQGGQYYHRLDPTKIAVMGQSCGGVQAIEASADPRVTTSMIWNSGLFPEPTTMAGGKAMTKDDLKLLHAPTAYISGDPQDVAYPNANDDFDKLTVIPVLRAYEKGVGHSGTYRESNGGEFGGVAVAWLSWRLKGDEKAGLMFAGKTCGLCVNPRWVVRKQKIE
jgi:hypothetical protein